MESSVAIEELVAAPVPVAVDVLEPVQRRRRSDLRTGKTTLETSAADAVARRDAVFRRSLGVADMVATTAAAVTTAALISTDLLNPLILLALPLIVVVAKTMGLYDRDELLLHKTTLQDGPALFQLSALTTFLLAMTQAPLHQS